MRSGIWARIARWSPSVFVVLSTLAANAASAAEAAHGIGLPRDVSTEGWRIDRLIIMTLWATGFLFVVMCAWMLWAVFAHGKSHKALFDFGDSKKAVMAKAGTAALIFLSVDGTLFVNSTTDLGQVFWNWKVADEDPNAVRIEINAHQWAWDARYAGPDKEFATEDDILSLNEIYVPVDTHVTFQMASTDVIHNFYIPNLRVKQDVVPGSITRAWFKAKETGEFEIACSQHCGANHYLMKAKLIVMSKADYEEWAAYASNVSKRVFEATDTDANWGWKWRKAE
ncbi:cupredoxin domain-containing protein [Myxococcota bacterium]|nr:cupredoxin domain-containing protein [Myxococcota bacterium]